MLFYLHLSFRIKVNIHINPSFQLVLKIKYLIKYNYRKTLPSKRFYIVGGLYDTHGKRLFFILPNSEMLFNI